MECFSPETSIDTSFRRFVNLGVAPQRRLATPLNRALVLHTWRARAFGQRRFVIERAFINLEHVLETPTARNRVSHAANNYRACPLLRVPANNGGNDA